MSKLNDERWAFKVEHFDPAADLVRQYELLYYLGDSTLEMYDIKNRRTFLKRTDYPSITPDHLFIGAEITVWSRNLKVVEYSDAFTKDKLAERSEKSVMQVPIGALPGAMAAVASAGLRVNKLKTIAQGGEKTVVMEVVAAGAVATTQGLGFECSADADAASADSDMFFGNEFPNGAQIDGGSLCLVLPHAVAENRAADIVQMVANAGLSISAVQQFSLGRANVAEFFEVYKGVLPEYQKKVIELTSGPTIAICVTDPQGGDSVGMLREVAGPYDPDIGRVIRQSTIRAKHGVDKVLNSVHVTDLAEDGQLEVEYFFNLLAKTAS